ncbi:MAG: NADH-quinone oxidoreductase subunit L [Chthoniobacteraceae bacterium]
MNPVWTLLLAPLVSAAVILLVTKRLKNLSAYLSVAAVLVSLGCALTVFFSPNSGAQVSWINLGGEFVIPIGYTIDELSKLMLLVVTVVGSLVHIYSLGYMAEDEGKSRFFAGLSLFMFSMLGIVLANNFVMMFIFWELVGVSSYILIGHWYDQSAPPAAANKAFIMNRLGDFGFMFGILMVWLVFKSFVFSDIQAVLVHSTHVTSLNSNELSALEWIQAHPDFLTISTLLIFCGAVGKSAQFPLHTWLPDAMEGPTPVSALIHAATMVAAGVYMLARVAFLVHAAPAAADVIAWIGTITMIMAALMATQQDDIKRILAYSTLSQLGYMVAAIGVLNEKAAMFHLFTHAGFKALLFLGSGSVILAMHHEQDIWKMGALKNKMPLTFLTFLVGTLALTGFPGLSGSFSKEMILSAAKEAHPGIFIIGVITAFLTAFYMFRLFIVVFLGKPLSDHAKHAHESPLVMTGPLLLLSIPSVFAGYHFFIGHFLALPEEHTDFLVLGLAIGAFILGSGLAWIIYRGKTYDPITIPLFARKFYFDEIYAWLVRVTQDLLATICGWFDKWVLDVALVRGLIAGGAWASGFAMRFLQTGNLQGYSFLFGAGVVILIYYVVLK